MTYINCLTKVTKNKPNNYINRNYKCPFCDRDELRKEGRIIRETEDFVIVENKYPVLQDAFSTVLIEHQSCGEHIGTYSIDYLTNLLRFSLNYYDELLNSGKFTSLVFFKNSGLMASGSIEHPHLQIMGLKNTNYQENIRESDFEGIPIISNQVIEWNLSTKPRSEFYEINIILHDKSRLDFLATYLQKSVNYILDVLNPKYKSYNIAFYVEEENIRLKIIPRWPSTVMLLGFGIHQTPDNLEETAQKLREY